MLSTTKVKSLLQINIPPPVTMNRKIKKQLVKLNFWWFSFIQSKEKTKMLQKSFFENVKVPCRVCLQITQSYVYALKLPSEVKIMSLEKIYVISLNLYSQARNRKLFWMFNNSKKSSKSFEGISTPSPPRQTSLPGYLLAPRPN